MKLLAKIYPHVTRWALSGLLIYFVYLGWRWALVTFLALVFIGFEIKSLADWAIYTSLSSAIARTYREARRNRPH